ncbi:HD domain-containing protein [bacterium]|nr:HD domain-containing protein [bacterium]
MEGGKMKTIPTDEIREGDVFGESLFSPEGEVVLASGHRLSKRDLGLLEDIGRPSYAIWEAQRGEKIPEEKIRTLVKRAVQYRLTQGNVIGMLPGALQYVRSEEILHDLRGTDPRKATLLIPDVANRIDTLLNDVISRHAALLASCAEWQFSDLEAEHAIQTAFLCVIIGLQFKLPWFELESLASAAMVHDAGRWILPQARPKERPDRAEERQGLRDHAVYSALLLLGTEPMALEMQTTVLHHHEHLDGSGRPLTLTGLGVTPEKGKGAEPGSGRIYRHAEIMAAVNAFHQYLRGLSVRPPEDAVDAMARLSREARSWWNLEVVQHLSETLHVFPPGSQVRIVQNSSRKYQQYLGVIVRTNPRDAQKPVILLMEDASGSPIKPIEVDFGREKFMKLELVHAPV